MTLQMQSLPEVRKKEFIKILSDLDFTVTTSNRKILQFQKFFERSIITIPNTAIVKGETIRSALIQGNISIADYVEKTKNVSTLAGKDSIFAFVDILGFTKLIQDAGKNKLKQNKILNRLNNAIKPAYTHFGDNIEIHRKYDRTGICDLRIFSDNVLFVWNIGNRNYGEPEIGETISLSMSYQLSLALKGFFSRGAIVSGFGYSDSCLIFGSPLLEAYTLESKRAKYPRIILSDDLEKQLKLISTMYSDPQWCPFSDLVLKTDDGIWFINYLFELRQFNDDMMGWVIRQKPDSPIVKMKYYPEAISLLGSHKNHISKNLKKFKGKNPHIYQKYFWLAQYHNFFCQTYFTAVPQLQIPKIKCSVHFFFPVEEYIKKSNEKERPNKNTGQMTAEKSATKSDEEVVIRFVKFGPSG